MPIFTARVPILKVVDAGTGVECDISVENKDGILKSQIVHMISLIDYRFQKLCFLVRRDYVLLSFKLIISHQQAINDMQKPFKPFTVVFSRFNYNYIVTIKNLFSFILKSRVQI